MKYSLTIIICLLTGAIAGWYGHERKVGANLLDSTAIASTLYLGRSQEFHETLSKNDIEDTKKAILDSMKNSIRIFEKYREKFCVRRGAELCEVIFNRVDNAKEYIKKVEEKNTS